MRERNFKPVEMLRELRDMLDEQYDIQVSDDHFQEMLDSDFIDQPPRWRSNIVHYKVPDSEWDMAYPQSRTACGSRLIMTNHTIIADNVTCKKCKKNKVYKFFMNKEKISFEF